MVKFTTDLPSTSTGVYASEDFNTRDTNGQLERLRHSKVQFPDGTVFGQYGAEVCTATQQDFQQKGLAACPKGSRLGSGNATVTTTGHAGDVAAPAGTEFAGQQSHEREAHPLSEAEWLQELPPRVLNGGRDRVDGRNWQRPPRWRS